DADHLRTVALPASRALLLPAEFLGAHVERFAQMRAGHAALAGAIAGAAVRGVDAPDLETIDAELARGFVDQRLDSRRDLVLPGTTLRSAWRRVRHDRHAAETHCRRRVYQGN